MVRFGVDTTDDFDDEDATAQQDVLMDEGPGPDDTFAYRLHMPGGFDSIQAEQSTGNDTQTSLTIRSSPKAAVQRPQEQDPQEEDDLMDLSPEGEILPVSATEEDRGDSPESTDYSSTMFPPSADDVPAAEGWPAELLASSNRYRLLAAHSRAPLQLKRRYATSKASYNQQDLDSDLFRSSGPFFSSTTTTSNNNDNNPRKLRRPGFIFSWTGSSSFLQSHNNSVSLRKISKRRFLECEQCMKTLLAHSVIGPVNNVPYATPKTSLTANAIFDTSMSMAMQSLWQLTSALFDPISITDPGVPPQVAEAVEQDLRRSALSRWLESCVAVVVNEDTNTTDQNGILAKLMGNQLVGACAAALSSGNLRLATLIPLAGGDQNMRDDMNQQLVYWRENGYSTHISPVYRTILEILSGNIVDALSTVKSQLKSTSGNDANVLWKRVFGLYLWFRLPKGASVEETMDVYDAEVGMRFQDLMGDSSDIQYELLRLFARRSDNMDALFDTSGVCSDSLDFHHNWMLYLYLTTNSSVGQAFDLDDVEIKQKADTLTKCFVDELDSLGMWEWSLFVGLHLHSDLAYVIFRLLLYLKQNADLLF